jgi:hypothetical protein
MTLFRKIRTVLRYVFPNAQDRVYLARIARAGQFDRSFYLAANPRLPALFRLWPARHYVQLGEGHGLCPNPRFSPRAYLFHNPDLGAADQRRPLLHYIQTGRAENRLVLAGPGRAPPMPEIMPEIISNTRAPADVAILAHVFYPDFWEEIAPLLAAQTFGFDLFVTLTEGPTTPALRARIVAAHPGAQVWVLPNHGRDIWPFIHLVNAGVFTPYRALCKLHSKKSPHRGDGDQWRQSLIGGILGDPVRTATRLARFVADDAAGFWVADGHAYHGDDWWGINRAQGLALLARAGIETGAQPLAFPAGSIYWVKPQLLDALRGLGLAADDFEPEQALVDGTLAHAMERSLGVLATHLGLAIVETRALDSPARIPLT